MRLMEGKIGRQESTSLLTLTLYTCSVFTVNSETAYINGNTTYIWLPAAVLISLTLFLLLGYIMKRSGKNGMSEFLRSALGKVGGGIFAAVVACMLLINAFNSLSTFVSMIHSFVYMDTKYINIAIWIMAVVAAIALSGMECIGRTAKCFGAFLLFVLLAELIMPVNGYELQRLYPAPGEEAGVVLSRAVSATVKSLPALLSILWLKDAMQGLNFVKKNGAAAALIAAVLCMLTQLATGLSYAYSELYEMYIPLYRLNMTLTVESYFLRQDKTALFLWLIGCIISGAYCVYGASAICARQYGVRDIRPGAAAFCAVLTGLIYLQHAGLYDAIKRCTEWVEQYGFMVIWALLLITLLSGAFKFARTKQKEQKL